MIEVVSVPGDRRSTKEIRNRHINCGVLGYLFVDVPSQGMRRQSAAQHDGAVEYGVRAEAKEVTSDFMFSSAVPDNGRPGGTRIDPKCSDLGVEQERDAGPVESVETVSDREFRVDWAATADAGRAALRPTSAIATGARRGKPLIAHRAQGPIRSRRRVRRKREALAAFEDMLRPPASDLHDHFDFRVERFKVVV